MSRRLPRLLDGAVGTELIRAGCDPARESPDAWALARPEAVRALHRRYVSAGAEAVHTDTFGATKPRLSQLGLADRVAELNLAAARLAREASSEETWVLGDLGPLAAPALGAEARIAAYREQALALAAGGVDAFHVETVLDADDLRAALAACTAAAPRIPAYVSLTLRRGPAGSWQSPAGELAERLAAVALAGGACGVGVNCTLDAVETAGAVRALRAVLPPGTALWAQPCASLPPAAPLAPQPFGAALATLLAAGASAVGGCCGTTPEHIAAARAALQMT